MKGSGPSAFLFYLAIRSAFALMQCFPIEWNLRTARLLAKVWPWVMPRHRHRALGHLADALGHQHSIRQLGHIADESLASVAMFAVEACCMPHRIHPTTWTRHIHLENFDEALRVLLAGRGAILVTGHYGSFELVGHLLAALGFDVAAVMRPLDNVYLNRFLVASRRLQGLALLDKKGASTHAEELLRRGALVGFIGDQDAGRKGLFVDFFGRPASTYKSIGLLAMAAEAPIIVGYARRRGKRAFYNVGVSRIIRPVEWVAQPDPLRWITQEYTAAIEEIVRAGPEQYLWIHRRWKSKRGVRKSSSPASASPVETKADRS